MPVETLAVPNTSIPTALLAAVTGVGESRVLLRGVGWDGYEAVLKLVGDGPVPRLAYIDGDLELMSPGYLHETLAERLGLIFYEILVGLRIRFRAVGHTTLRRRDVDRGVEGDKAFYFTHLDMFDGKDSLDLDVDPPPDLAIEVEVSRPIANRLQIYSGLGVPEVWTLSKSQGLRFLHLGPHGVYAPAAASRALPFLAPADVIPWLDRSEGGVTPEWATDLRDWIQETLAPRLRPIAGDPR